MSVKTPLMACAAALALAWSLALPASGQSNSKSLPPRLGDYVSRIVRLTPVQQQRLLNGDVVTKLLDADPSREIAVFGAVWVKAPIALYIESVKDIEQFEKGENFLVTKQISSPPKLADFAALRLPPDDVADLKVCRVGACELKLSEGALLRIRREIDWAKPTAAADAEALIRQLALDYVNGYLEGGNARLAAYRDSKRPVFVEQEFSSMISRMPSLSEFLPGLKQYLLGFPKAQLENTSSSFLYWQEAKFGLKPTVRINHLTIVQEPTHALVTSKMLYASHYFWTALELRVLVPDPARGQGFWLVTLSRSRSDGLSGFIGSLIRGKVRSEAEKGIQAVLTSTKAAMERP